VLGTRAGFHELLELQHWGKGSESWGNPELDGGFGRVCSADSSVAVRLPVGVLDLEFLAYAVFFWCCGVPLTVICCTG